MEILAVIPSRYNSRRLPGKALADIRGKPMIQWVWEAVNATKSNNHTIIATDDERIYNISENFGAEVLLTSCNCQSGTDRVAEVLQRIEPFVKPDFVLNIQGDEPLLTPTILESFVEELRRCTAPSATIVAPANDLELADPATVKVVIDRRGNALYFSRAAIPHIRDGSSAKVLKHIGIYAYRPDFLLEFASMQPTPLELAENLEQLRVLENGYAMFCVEIPAAAVLTGVDTAQDLEKVRNSLLR